MEDIAHGASGPASPSPGDRALPQASRPDSPDRGKLRVFISYSRDDLEFADQLDAALNACGFECVIDRHGISGGEDWKRRLGNLIREADTVVFVLTRTSARSEICTWEAEEAERLGKRILPVMQRPLEGASPPLQLRERNYIFFYADPKAAPGAGFGTGLAKLIAALNTDFDWLREHTRYLQRATEWDRGGRPANRLLSGDDIAEAKAWVARRPKNAPEPTSLHLDFIRASEEEAEARSSAQRKQFEAMAAAQAERATALNKAEEALKQAADAQRRRARIRNIALVIVSIFAVLAGSLGLLAEKQRRAAEEQRAVAEEQREQADGMLAGAARIFRKLQGQMDNETQEEFIVVFVPDASQAGEWFEKALGKGDVRAMSKIGWLYENGFGFSQDYARAFEWYHMAAVRGDAISMHNLGLLYANGQGVMQDYARAREWYAQAANKGNAGAMVGLGLLYQFGHGVEQNDAKAREWYEKAADKGNPIAMHNLGGLYDRSQDYVKAREWYEKAAAKGFAGAMHNLGGLYYNGYGVAQDYVKAREWYEKAAAKGYALPMLDLGGLYLDGRGVVQDYAKAREWYEKAADKGNASAKAKLEQLSISEAFGAGRYAEALQLQEALAAKMEGVETKREGSGMVRPVCARIYESVDRRRARARASSRRTRD